MTPKPEPGGRRDAPATGRLSGQALAWAAGALALLLLWGLLARREDAGPSVAVAEAASAVAGRPGSASSPETGARTPLRSIDVGGAALAASAAPAASVLAQAPVRTHWDLCGVGVLPVAPGTADPEQLPAHLGEDLFAAAREQLWARWERGSVREQVVASLWRGIAQAGQHLGGETDPAQSLRKGIARAVALASASEDAQAQRWALGQCLAYSLPCGALDARRLAHADPGNAAAWLLLLAQRPEARAEAEAGLARATEHRLGAGGVSAMLLATPLPDLQPYVRHALLAETLGQDVWLEMNALQTQIQSFRCQPRAAPGSAQAQACESLTQALTQRSDTLFAQTIGWSYGDRLGWPKAQVSAGKARLKALQREEQDAHDFQQPFACAQTERLRRQMADRARVGEVAALEAMRPRR